MFDDIDWPAHTHTHKQGKERQRAWRRPCKSNHPNLHKCLQLLWVRVPVDLNVEGVYVIEHECTACGSTTNTHARKRCLHVLGCCEVHERLLAMPLRGCAAGRRLAYQESIPEAHDVVDAGQDSSRVLKLCIWGVNGPDECFIALLLTQVV